MHKRGADHAIDYYVGSDGNVLAKETFNESKNKHSIFAFHGKKAVEIFSEETPYPTKGFIGVSLDETKLFILDNNNENNRSAIYTLALKDGKVEGPLYDRSDADIIDTVTDTQKKLLGVVYSGFNPSYTFFDSDLDQRVQEILSKFRNESVFIEEISPDRKHVIVRVEGSQSAGEYFLYSKGKQAALLTSRRPDFKADAVHPIAAVEFAARDGLNIPTLITVPKSKVDCLKKLPAIMMPHGGPESFDSIRFDYLAQAFVEQGYLVIQPQFRGSLGFGLEHQAAGYGEWGQKALYDLSDALGFFSKQGIVDPERVCIVGASYGGYSALAGGAFTPDQYKCVVSINGIGNLNDLLNRERTERGRSSSSLAFWEAQILGFGEASNKNTAKLRSPELKASSFRAPVLLIHSEKDKVVHPRQSISMFRALNKAGKKVERVELKGEDHYLSNGKTRLQALRSAVAFVQEHIN